MASAWVRRGRVLPPEAEVLRRAKVGRTSRWPPGCSPGQPATI